MLSPPKKYWPALTPASVLQMGPKAEVGSAGGAPAARLTTRQDSSSSSQTSAISGLGLQLSCTRSAHSSLSQTRATAARGPSLARRTTLQASTTSACKILANRLSTGRSSRASRYRLPAAPVKSRATRLSHGCGWTLSFAFLRKTQHLQKNGRRLPSTSTNNQSSCGLSFANPRQAWSPGTLRLVFPVWTAAAPLLLRGRCARKVSGSSRWRTFVCRHPVPGSRKSRHCRASLPCTMSPL
jgi:hypothetical protein